ncbi:hypothetical protein [Alteromonas mediterranea]|uniref:hypothetical protein n=1 Tax=Alteromonas mediterranea TaxID=314275 RepID=UPI001AD8095C|nr:hypothetical protein [Alteromonas mediterranea]
MKKFWDIDHNSYVPENQNVKNKPLWLARQEKLLKLTEQEIRSEKALAEYHEKIEKAHRGFSLLISKLKKIKKSIEKWSFSFLQEQFILAANFATPLAKELEGLENNSRSTAENILTAVSKIEETIPHAPATAKVTNKVFKQKP